MREFSHAEVINDQEWDGCELRHIVLARASEGRVGEFLQQGVHFTVDHAISLLDGGSAGLDPVSWTSSERWIRCPDRWQTLPSAGRAGDSMTTSRPKRCAW